MKLGIISDSHHYYNSEGELYNLTILAAQFDCWAQMFDEVIICAPLISGLPPNTHSRYACKNIRLIPISPAGGNSIRAKANLIYQLPGWWKSLQNLVQSVDAIHIRCPNNISILGLLACQKRSLLRQAIYTGSWVGHPGEPLTYRWQRLYLKRFFRGPVAVYGDWQKQFDHIVPSFSPSYPQADWEMEESQVENRIKSLKITEKIKFPVRLLSVGSLSKNKNQQLILISLSFLLKKGVDFSLNLLGDGDQRLLLEQLTGNLELQEKVHFHGNVDQETVRKFYRESDFVIQAPFSEGFGKVPIEAFFHGVIPILSDVDISRHIIGDGNRGRCFPQGDAEAIARNIVELVNDPNEMARLIENGRKYSLNLTLEAWQQHLCNMLNRFWKTALMISNQE